MKLHLSYFELRKSQANCDSRKRQWIDLSSLETFPGTQRVSKLHLFKARFSFLICGESYKKWVGYAFDDRDANEERWDCETFSCADINEDWIASEYERDGLSDDESDYGISVVNANCPIWDPREYFLLVVEKRLAEVLEHWQEVMREIEITFAEFVC